MRRLGQFLAAGLLVLSAVAELSCSSTFHPPGRAVELDGNLGGAPYKIRVPAEWNGTLLLYAHGYRKRARAEGEPEVRTAADAPGPLESPWIEDMEPVLLSKGYALAGSAFRSNGWSVREGIEDTLALRDFFFKEIGPPRRTIVWGLSLGAMVVARSVEETPRAYDGAICACGVGAGATRSWDRILDLSLAYDVALGWPQNWGTPRSVASDIQYERDVAPAIVAHLQDRDWLGRLEFIRLIVGVGPEDFYKPAVGRPAMLDLMFFATEGRAELQARVGGPVGQNLDRHYVLTHNEKVYLASLGVDANSLLAKMNARRDSPPAAASAQYLASNADYSGRLSIPVLTMHTMVDGLVSASQESAYRDTVRSAGRESKLMQTFTDGVGHCLFRTEQFAAAIRAMETWLANGRKPGDEAFTSEDGFVATFRPPPWRD